MRVLVTGATGFIGRIVGERLQACGHEVRALVRGPRGAARLEASGLPGVTLVEGDLLDHESLGRAVTSCEAVVHLAAVVAPSLQSDEVVVERTNRDASVALARLARDAGCARFVFVSSIAAMGFFSGTATPASPCAPVTAYGRAKLEAEREIVALGSERFVPVILRPPTVYGPGERYNFLSLTQAVARGVFRIIGSGTNVMPLCTRDNVARACVAAAEGSVPRGVHLVADDARYSMKRIHAALASALGVRRPRLHIPLRAALVAGAANEALHRFGAPLVLSRSRVRTLTVDQPFDVSSLRAAGVALDAPLEREVARTVAEYRSAGVLVAAR